MELNILKVSVFNPPIKYLFKILNAKKKVILLYSFKSVNIFV